MSYAWEELATVQDFSGNISCCNTSAPMVMEQNIEKLHFYRDDKYGIHINAEGIMPEGYMDEDEECAVVGTIVSGGEIVCDTIFQGVVIMKNCIWRSNRVEYHLNSGSQNRLFRSIRHTR